MSDMDMRPGSIAARARKVRNAYPPMFASEVVGELLALAREVRRLRGLILDAEWEGQNGDKPCCPWCGGVSNPTTSDERAAHSRACDAFVGRGNVR
jgi:hypothetical protein